MVYDKWQRMTVPERHYHIRHMPTGELEVERSQGDYTWSAKTSVGGWRFAKGRAKTEKRAKEMAEAALEGLTAVGPNE